ncbi:ferric-rhodotorulic acid transporter [Stenotrophomonas panacihumi]|uniref:Ferric-rhodotorulic acid transporter n=1 Tax=Stenotrophomonas panacihumi TaxID=676599 RepID=A0A0R0A7J6_9GAMM|nr:ferric-rhodotorulic acid/ferric-coprogen receptor FhuE [Stenotrophomonas panacihumi]KRG40959.1 ferric-rhodotorulic acid transporter [Stenotrophomonas panacihumi]PTN53880.1 TonB-dependent siderophore receptor [Stenotrophomonas panacihumi]
MARFTASSFPRFQRTALAAACALATLPAWAAEAPAASGDVQTLDRLNVAAARPTYTVEKVAAGTRFELAPREIPQSVTVVTQARMKDQNLQSIGEVLNNVTGVSYSQTDSERVEFFARGFYIDNYQFDGLPTTMDQAWSYGDSALDLAIYDRVEIVRGATGLLTGAGNPSASVNLVRKHADSREFTGSVSVAAGSFGKTRSTVDVTTPLNSSGSVRARVIGNYTDSESWVDRYNQNKTLGYAVIDADLGANTLLSVGYDYQKKNSNDVTWGGFPLWYSDGSRTDYGKSFNPAADWTYWDTTVKRAFATLETGFANGWKLKLNATHDESNVDDKLFYPFYTIYGFDKQTGGGVVPYSGYYITERKVDGVDGYTEGPFQLFGRQHRFMGGVSYNRREYSNLGRSDFPGPLDSYLGWTGAYPEPDWSASAVYPSGGEITQKAAYAALRLSLADPLSAILGARYTDWKSEGEGADRSHKVTTPYAGLVYDFNDTWSTYASYTEIFQPQTYRGANGSFLDPVTGKSYEAGVKAAWFDNRLNASAAVFRIEQDNVAQPTGVYLPSGEQVYAAAKGTVSEGFEFEVSGELREGWNATFGASHYTARDANDTSINKQLPRTSIKLFTSYTPSGEWHDLTVGGGVNWQNRIYYVDAVYGEFEQDGYALVSAFARYRLAPQFSVQLNLNNLLDKRYYSQINSGYGAFGAPRNGELSFNWTF